MAIVDTHCHASPYWYAPVESLLDEMNRSRVDKAVLIQIGGMYDNSYLIECIRRFPGRFSVGEWLTLIGLTHQNSWKHG